MQNTCTQLVEESGSKQFQHPSALFSYKLSDSTTLKILLVAFNLMENTYFVLILYIYVEHDGFQKMLN